MIGSNDDGPRWGQPMGCAIVLTALFTIGPLFLLRGCEAFLLTTDSTERVGRSASPDGRWVVEVEREPGMDGNARHDVYLTDLHASDAPRQQLRSAGDMRRHEVRITWSKDSTLFVL